MTVTDITIKQTQTDVFTVNLKGVDNRNNNSIAVDSVWANVHLVDGCLVVVSALKNVPIMVCSTYNILVKSLCHRLKCTRIVVPEYWNIK